MRKTHIAFNSAVSCNGDTTMGVNSSRLVS